MANCPVHASVSMVFVPAKDSRVSWHKSPSSAGEAEEMETIKTRTGILRCPVAGCFRVESFEPVTQRQVKRCPRCGDIVTEVSASRSNTYDYRCKPCLAKASKVAVRKAKIDKERALKRKIEKELHEKGTVSFDSVVGNSRSFVRAAARE